MTSAALAAAYASAARVLAKNISDRTARMAARSTAAALSRMEENEAGFLKARVASFLRALMMNSEQVGEVGHGEMRELLTAGANLLLLLPDEVSRSSGRLRHNPRFARPVPERD